MYKLSNSRNCVGYINLSLSSSIYFRASKQLIEYTPAIIQKFIRGCQVIAQCQGSLYRLMCQLLKFIVVQNFLNIAMLSKYNYTLLLVLNNLYAQVKGDQAIVYYFKVLSYAMFNFYRLLLIVYNNLKVINISYNSNTSNNRVTSNKYRYIRSQLLKAKLLYNTYKYLKLGISSLLQTVQSLKDAVD